MDTSLSHQKSLRWRIVGALLIAAFLPLALASFGSWIVFGRLIEHNKGGELRIAARSHANAIEVDLAGSLQLMRLAAGVYDLGKIDRAEKLRDLFGHLNSAGDKRFIDIGVIDETGRHLAYLGPYDLSDKNYREAEWFKEVSVSGEYISDVFLGFRRVPHCIVAIKMIEDGNAYILRATINSDRFNRLVANVPLGEGTSAYVVNQEGIYQTAPAGGSILEKSPIEGIGYHQGAREERLTSGGVDLARVMVWIEGTRWLLVVEQNLAAVQAPVNQAIAAGASVVVVAIALLVITAFLATWHLARRIDRATAERDEMSHAFLRSAKLASIGELATGLAHEINNPLAIISAEQTNIRDLLGTIGSPGPERDEIRSSIDRSLAQIDRCAGITRKMLKFGRKEESRIVPTGLDEKISEILQFYHRRAAILNVTIYKSIEDGLPDVMVDPLELEQVFINVINNSLDALPRGGTVTVAAYRDGDRVHVLISDDGVGISQRDLAYVFEPFFTTKEVGKGTGLGLSVCYGMVKAWGGDIDIESKKGMGTTVRIGLLSVEGAVESAAVSK